MALALPDVRWLEYSFQNFDHLVEEPFVIEDGLIRGKATPGHGLELRRGIRDAHGLPAARAGSPAGAGDLGTRQTGQ
jgi:L-alanine-DL-glutamate epimerase-like enolase superfamily enzyme